MINSINLKNFQSHKEAKLDFDPGVNVIIGRSDSGKTAILRAINWVVNNRPLGEAFRSYGSDLTEVEISIDGHKVGRTRGDKINRYTLDGQNFDAVSSEVPEEITKALNIAEVNIQKQLDQPFLLSNSPGAVASHFNQVAHLDKIDFSTKAVKNWIRDIKWKLQGEEARLKKLKEDLVEFEDLDNFEAKVINLECLANERDTLTRDIPTVKKYKEGIKEASEEIEKKKIFLQVEKPLEKVIELKEKYSQRCEDLKKIKALHAQIKIDTTLCGKLTKLAELDIAPILDMRDNKEKLNFDQGSLRGLLDLMEENEEKHRREEKLYKDLQKKFKKAFPEVCPLCGQKIIKEV